MCTCKSQVFKNLSYTVARKLEQWKFEANKPDFTFKSIIHQWRPISLKWHEAENEISSALNDFYHKNKNQKPPTTTTATKTKLWTLQRAFWISIELYIVAVDVGEPGSRLTEIALFSHLFKANSAIEHHHGPLLHSSSTNLWGYFSWGGPKEHRESVFVSYQGSCI